MTGIAVYSVLTVLWPVHQFRKIQNAANKFGKLFGDHPKSIVTLQ